MVHFDIGGEKLESIEEQLKEEIKKKYGSIKKFAESTGIPYTTMDSILKRGIKNATAANILKIVNALDLALSYKDDGTLDFYKIYSQNLKNLEENTVISNHGYTTAFYRDDYTGERTEEEKEMYFINKMDKFYELLNDKGQEKAIEQVELLTKIPEYRKDTE